MSRRELIEDFCEEYGYDFKENYSGRFTYGKSCVGIVYNVDDNTVLDDLEEYLMSIEEFDFAKSIRDLVSYDSVGFLLGVICFPSIS